MQEGNPACVSYKNSRLSGGGGESVRKSPLSPLPSFSKTVRRLLVLLFSIKVLFPSTMAFVPSLPLENRGKLGTACGRGVFVLSHSSWIICCAPLASAHRTSHKTGRVEKSRNSVVLVKCSASTSVANGNASSFPTSSTPEHVAFICDGNSRWAASRSLPASVGHAAGADRLLSILECLKSKGVKVCTMYGFSTENWSRPAEEINDIFTIMEQTALGFREKALAEGVRVKILGDLDDERLPRSLRGVLLVLEQDTFSVAATKGGAQEGLMVCLAVNYGGRADIVSASRKLSDAISQGVIGADEVDDSVFGSYLHTAGVPDPDLIIRTGGEQRLSNFLLWNAAYSELYFTDKLWPDFNEASLDEALDWYTGRIRRFGSRCGVEKLLSGNVVNAKESVDGKLLE